MPVPGPGGCEVSPRRARGWISRSAHAGGATCSKPHGIEKGDFDWVEEQIATAARAAQLPLDIVAEDGARAAEHLERLDDDPEEEAQLDRGRRAHPGAALFSPIVVLGATRVVYVEMLVEKIDLKSLFKDLCEKYHIPLTNARGWSDLNSRAAHDGALRRWKPPASGLSCSIAATTTPTGCRSPTSSSSNMRDLAEGGGLGTRQSDHRPLRAQRRLHRPEQVDLDRRVGDLVRKAAGRPDTPEPLQTLRPELPAPIRRAQGRGDALVAAPEAGRALCREAILRHLPRTRRTPIWPPWPSRARSCAKPSASCCGLSSSPERPDPDRRLWAGNVRRAPKTLAPEPWICGPPRLDRRPASGRQAPVRTFRTPVVRSGEHVQDDSTATTMT